MSTILVGPPKRGGTVTNPSKAPDEGSPIMLIVGYLLPIVLGGGIGALEGTAAAGKAEWWRKLNPHIKWSVLSAIAGVLLWLENFSDDEAIRVLAIRANGAVSAFATMYAVMKAIASKVTPKTSEPKVGPDGKASKGLASLSALAAQDAQDARAAVRELVRRRAEWAPDPTPEVAGLGEIQRQVALGEITLEPGLDII